MRAVTKREVQAELEAGGYISKPIDPALGSTTFHCDKKHCKKLLDNQFELNSFNEKNGYPIPSSVAELKEAMERNASNNNFGAKDPVGEVPRRCLICMYRAYRRVYYRKYKSYPDDDVPDDFSNVFAGTISKTKKASPSPKSKPKPVTPKKAPAKTSSSIDLFLADVHPIWALALKSYPLFAKVFAEHARNRELGKFLVVVVPEDKVVEHLLIKSKFTKDFMNHENLTLNKHPLKDILKCAFGSIEGDVLDKLRDGVYIAEELRYGHSEDEYFRVTHSENATHIDGIRAQIVERNDVLQIAVIKIRGILSTLKINDRINKM
jgi:hypothetical protein